MKLLACNSNPLRLHGKGFAKRIFLTKLTLFLFAVFCFNAMAKGYSQTVTLSVKDAPLEVVFKEITRQTGYNFVYTESLLHKSKPVSLFVNNASLIHVLTECFKEQRLTFSILQNLVIIKEKAEITTGRKIETVQLENTSSRSATVASVVVSGLVTDDKNAPLSGVSVIVKGTNNGTRTNKNGRFTLTVEDPGSTLVFSSVGFTSFELPLNGRTDVTAKLNTEPAAMQDVVVTALGIKKEAKSLGYAAATVGGEQVTVNRTTNFANALTGKIAGVNITSMGTGPGGTSKVRIRGQSSFSGNNTPLIVVNGVPIDNSNFGARGDAATRGSYRDTDGGDGLSSINPDDIESITVLKGAAASALYGSRAKDGVLMITTKTRAKGNGIGIEYNVNFTHETPLDYTDYQYVYGQGENGVRPTAPNPTSGNWSFGEKFQPGMTQVLFDGVTVPYEAQPHQFMKFYRNAHSLTNTVTVSSGGEFGGFNLTLSNLNATGIYPTNDFNRRNVDLGFTQVLAKKLTITGTVSYSNEKRNNPTNVGQQDFSPVSLFNLANSMPMDILKKYATNAAGDEFAWSRFTDRTNPYFSLLRFDHITRDRMFGNVSARYDFAKSLYIQGRIGQDFYSRFEDYNLPTGAQRMPAAPAGFVNGEYVQDERRFRELNTDLLLGTKHNFGVFGIDVTLGGNQMRRKLERNNTLATDFYSRGLYTLGNARLLSPIYEISERQVNSVYGAAEVSYKGFVYVNGTLRNDWFSTLSPENRSILYPSITTSFIFSQALRKYLPEWISYGKIRAAYAEVGSDTDVPPYSNSLYYIINPSLFANSAGAGQPVGGINATVVPNPALKPMRVSEKEIGLELKLFNNRVGVEVSYYDKLSSDQIIQAQTSDASGYQYQLINAGESQNKGVEMLLNFSPISTKNFEWNVNYNAAYNTSKVLSLGSSVNDSLITVGTGEFTGELRQVVGKPIGQLYGYGFLRDEAGKQVFDAGNGRPLRTANQVDFGSALPTWTGGITNSFNYKGLSFSFLIDFKLGNKMISGTNFNAYRHGLSKETLPGREQGYIIGDGVNLNKQVNTTKSVVQAYYETVRSQNIAEPFVYNAGLWQLRQMSLGYDFTKYVTRVKIIKGLRLNAVANNVAVLKKWVPNIHPEQFGFASDNLIGLEATGLPITRSVGFNLNVKF